MGYPRTTPKVLAALEKRRGRNVSREELVTATGLTDEQIRSAIRSLIDRENQPIKIVQRGAMWYLPEEGEVSRPARVARPIGGRPGSVIRSAPKVQVPDEDEIFERVPGRTQSGDVLVRGDATDTIYRVVPL